MRLIIITLLLVGLGVGVYLVRNQNTNTASRASASIINAFEIRDGNGNVAQCQENTENGVPICEIGTLNYTITMKDPKALQSVPTN